MAKIISTQETKKTRKAWWQSSRAFGIGAVLIVCSLAAWAVMNSSLITKKSNTKELAPTVSSQDAYNEAITLANNGKYNEAAQQLQQQTDTTTGKVEKAFAYLRQSVLAGNNGKFQEGLNLAKQSEALDPTLSSSNQIAAMLAQLGRKDEAIQQYKISLSRISQDDQMANSARRYIEEQIIELGGGL